MEASSLKTLYIYYTTGWQQRSPAVVLLCSRKRGSNFFALKTLHIYYTTQIALESSERLNDALHLLYPVDCDLFRPCVYCTTGLPTINPIYLLYHRVTIWWHVHYTAGWQTFSWCIHLTTGVTRVSPLQNPCIYYTTGLP